MRKSFIPKICPLNVMSVTWNCLYTPFLLESFQLSLEIKIKYINGIPPYFFNLKIVMICLPLQLYQFNSQILIFENNIPTERNKIKHKTPSVYFWCWSYESTHNAIDNNGTHNWGKMHHLGYILVAIRNIKVLTSKLCVETYVVSRLTGKHSKLQ